MFSRFINNSQRLYRSASCPNLRTYANYGLNEVDNVSPDPRLMTNNPPIGKKAIRHPEIHRTRCNQPGCTGKVCIGLCSEAIDRKAIAHATHGQSPAHETDKKTISAMQGQDFDGKSKDQNLVFYKNAHNVNQTPDLTQGTSKIQTDAKLQKLILDNEDIK